MNSLDMLHSGHKVSFINFVLRTPREKSYSLLLCIACYIVYFVLHHSEYLRSELVNDSKIVKQVKLKRGENHLTKFYTLVAFAKLPICRKVVRDLKKKSLKQLVFWT